MREVLVFLLVSSDSDLVKSNEGSVLIVGGGVLEVLVLLLWATSSGMLNSGISVPNIASVLGVVNRAGFLVTVVLAMAPFDVDGIGQIAGALEVLRVPRGTISAGLFRAAADLSMTSLALACPRLLILFLSSSSPLFCSGVRVRRRSVEPRVDGRPVNEDVRRCMGGFASSVNTASSIMASRSCFVIWLLVRPSDRAISSTLEDPDELVFRTPTGRSSRASYSDRAGRSLPSRSLPVSGLRRRSGRLSLGPLVRGSSGRETFVVHPECTEDDGKGVCGCGCPRGDS